MRRAKLPQSVLPSNWTKQEGKADAEDVEEVEERSTEDDWIKKKEAANVRT